MLLMFETKGVKNEMVIMIATEKLETCLLMQGINIRVVIK
jgi:hypothetical protein